jgi:hypothetical protein
MTPRYAAHHEKGVTRATVWRVLPGNWMTDGLIAFAFEHKPQDIDRFQRKSLRGSSHADGERA